MKNRKIALIITFIAVFMSVAMLLTFGAFAEGEVVKGDLTGDGVVDQADVDALMSYFASYDYDTTTSAVTLNGDADMNNSGTITLVDLIMLRAEAAKTPAHEHSWSDATCTTPKTCTTCGVTEGEANGHNWADATCTAPKTCTTCGATEGEANGHAWADADCDTPKTCTTCGATEGEANGHAWADATCTAPKTCSVCTATEGEANGHAWEDADCTTPKTCTTCGATEGEANGHKYDDGVVTQNPTCTEKGVKTFTCACGDKYTEDVDATGIHADNNADYKCDGCETLMLPAANEALTIPQAIAVANAAGTTYTTQKYYVTGVIKSVANTTYGNLYIEDEAGNELYIYGLYSADGKTRYDAMKIKPVAGDEITVYTVLGLYVKDGNTSIQGKDAWIDEVVTGHDHEYSFDCDTVCNLCGDTREAADHTWDNDCDADCNVCGATREPAEHDYVDGVCSSCGKEQPAQGGEETEGYAGVYYIAAKRSSGNFFYMTSNLGTASTKRYTAVDSKLTELPAMIQDTTEGYIFVLEKNEDGTYYIYARDVDGDNYLGWSSSNSGILVAKASAKKFTIEEKEGKYNIYFVNGSETRYLSLNNTSGNNYFAFYTSTQARDLSLIPVNECLHEGSTSTITTTATCDEASYTITVCDDCKGEISREKISDAFGHSYNEEVTTAATCTTNGVKTFTCGTCGDSYTETIKALGHTAESGTCGRCGEVIGGSSIESMATTKYSFSSYTAGTQYAQGEEHQLDANTKLTINGAHLNTQIRLYAGSNCVFEWTKTVEKIKLNAGNKAGTLTVYVSNDGSSWTEVKKISTTTSMTEYSVELGGSYQYVKLQSTGAQIRVSILTVNP